MNRILVLNGNKMERDITGRVLTQSLPGAEVLLTDSQEAALRVMKEESVDMLVADVPVFDMNHCNFIVEVKKTAGETPILVTSAGEKQGIAGQVWRLGINDYLLKPYRPNWLVAAVKALSRDDGRGVCCWEDRNRRLYLDRMEEHVHQFQYKKCTEDAREYLDSLHKNVDNVSTLRAEVVAFAEAVVKLGEPFGPAVQWKLSGCLEQFKSRFDLQSRKHDSYQVLQRLLDMIFETMEDSRLYKVGDEQRILNYIDRNVRKGISLDEAADYVNMSSCYFSKFFKKITGENFITYVTDRKIEIAKQMLLDTDLPVINIAYELSYSETNYFSKAFKKKVGLTPTEYRERGGEPLTVTA